MTSQVQASLSEAEIVQNPALGAFLLWHFGLGFQSCGRAKVPLPLAFLVLPIVLYRPTLDAVISTQKNSGLSLFTAKFAKNKEHLVGLQGRAISLRKTTLESVGVAATAGLIRIDYETADMRSFDRTVIGVKNPTVPERLKSLPKASEKLGIWFSRLSMGQVSLTLGVEF